MRSMHYYIKLAVVCASLGLTAIFGQAQEIAERNLSPLHWRYDVRVKRSADGKSLRFSLHVDAMTRLESQNVLVIYPSLVSASGDDRIDFAPVVSQAGYDIRPLRGRRLSVRIPGHLGSTMSSILFRT